MKRDAFSVTRIVFAALAFAACNEEKAPPPEATAPQKIEVEPLSLEFSGVRPGMRESKIAHVRNSGGQLLRVSSIIADNSVFTVTPTDLQVGPGASADLTVTFDAREDTTAIGNVIISSDDPLQARTVIEVRATSRDCNLDPSQHVIQFGETDSDAVLYLTNLGAEVCTVHSILLPTPTTFEFQLQHPLPFNIEPGASAPVVINWPTRIGAVREPMRIHSDDPKDPELTIQLVGWSYFDSHPCLELIYNNQIDLTPVGSVSAAWITIHNLSPLDCEVPNPNFTDFSNQMTAVFREEKPILHANELNDLIIFFQPTTRVDTVGQGNFGTSDPRMALYFGFNGSSYVPKVCVEPDEIHFGSTTSSVTITACGDTGAVVTRVGFDVMDPRLRLTGADDVPWSLALGEQRTVNIETIGAVGQNTWTLYVDSDETYWGRHPVRVTNGGDLLPVAAGRYLDYDDETDVSTVRMPLQGALYPAYAFPALMLEKHHASPPDGRYLSATLVDGPGPLRIYDRWNQVNTTLADRVWGPVSWRPDPQTQPAYQFVYRNAASIRVASPFAPQPFRTLSGAGETVFPPAWGPLGTIAFLVLKDGAPMLRVVGENGGVLDEISGDFDTSAAPPAFSPDGLAIALTKGTGGIALHPTGDLAHPIDLDLGTNPTDPSFSFDGQYLAFVRGAAIYVVAIDTATGEVGPETTITSSGNPRHPTFSR